jgi:hypothetical protein
MVHKLEKIFNAPYKDILEAILHGFRAQVDVKGKLAEFYLFKVLKKLNEDGVIQELSWNDKDGEPDFYFTYKGKKFRLECKNLRNEVFKKPYSYKVEIQKTRNSKDGTNTRSYPVDHFDILAVCLFNQTGKWDHLFISADKLERVPNNPRLLKIMQRVPVTLQEPWKDDILFILDLDADQ